MAPNRLTNSRHQQDPQVPQAPSTMRNDIDMQAVQLLPTFHGSDEENVQDVILQFENISNLANWTEEQKGTILKAKLRDKALKFILNDEETRNENKFTTLKHHLSKRFQKSQSLTIMQNEFNNIKQLPLMSVRDLAQKIREKSNNFLGKTGRNEEIKLIKDKINLAKFLETVRSDIRLELKKSDIQSFDQAVNKAVLLEAIFDEEVSTVNNLNTQTTQQRDTDQLLKELEFLRLKEEVKELKEQLKNMEATLTANLRLHTDEPFIICQICNKPGHGADTCWFRDGNFHQTPDSFQTINYRPTTSYNRRTQRKFSNFERNFRQPRNNYREQHTNARHIHNWRIQNKNTRWKNPNCDTKTQEKRPVPEVFRVNAIHVEEQDINPNDIKINEEELQSVSTESVNKKYHTNKSNGKILRGRHNGRNRTDVKKTQKIPQTRMNSAPYLRKPVTAFQKQDPFTDAYGQPDPPQKMEEF